MGHKSPKGILILTQESKFLGEKRKRNIQIAYEKYVTWLLVNRFSGHGFLEKSHVSYGSMLIWLHAHYGSMLIMAPCSYGSMLIMAPCSYGSMLIMAPCSYGSMLIMVSHVVWKCNTSWSSTWNHAHERRVRSHSLSLVQRISGRV